MVLCLNRWILCTLYNRRFLGAWKFCSRPIFAQPEHSLGDIHVSTLATQASHDIAELKHVSNFN